MSMLHGSERSLLSTFGTIYVHQLHRIQQLIFINSKNHRVVVSTVAYTITSQPLSPW